MTAQIERVRMAVVEAEAVALDSDARVDETIRLIG